jgi:basic amino acid/polyamine antiporter, APA family
MRHSLFRKKSIDAILKESEEGLGDAHHSHSGLKKVLGVRDLTFMAQQHITGARE